MATSRRTMEHHSHRHFVPITLNVEGSPVAPPKVSIDSSEVPQVWRLRSEGSWTSHNGSCVNFLGDGTIFWGTGLDGDHQDAVYVARRDGRRRPNSSQAIGAKGSEELLGGRTIMTDAGRFQKPASASKSYRNLQLGLGGPGTRKLRRAVRRQGAVVVVIKDSRRLR